MVAGARGRVSGYVLESAISLQLAESRSAGDIDSCCRMPVVSSLLQNARVRPAFPFAVRLSDGQFFLLLQIHMHFPEPQKQCSCHLNDPPPWTGEIHGLSQVGGGSCSLLSHFIARQSAQKSV